MKSNGNTRKSRVKSSVSIYPVTFLIVTRNGLSVQSFVFFPNIYTP